MRVFDEPNMNGFECPICKTNENKPFVLIDIPGTEEENRIQAIEVHVDCLHLGYYKNLVPGKDVIAMII